MDNFKQKTVDTYNKSAKELAEYFRGIGPRIEDIDRAFELVGNPSDAKVVEIGCGDGRDAKEIVKRTKNYIGFDIAQELIKLARVLVPQADFTVADAAEFSFPAELDIVFAFASLLHLDQQDLKKVFKRVEVSLKPGGVFYLSLKYAPHYQETVKKDKFGERLFYLYDPDLVKELAGSGYECVYSNQKVHGNTDWIELAFQKKP